MDRHDAPAPAESRDERTSPPVTPTWRAFVETLEAQAAFGLDFGLERISRALEAEGRPSRAHAAIGVAGTNGKGSTAAMIAGIARAHGLDVGLFTSPHLLDVRERFRLNGTLLPRERVRRVGARVLSRYADGGEGPVQLTYFELTALIAALLFRESDVDLALYEVGLGGRLDAVNALDLDLSAFTPVGLDHTDVLGDSIEEIAAEKAAVARSDRPAVVGRQPHDEARRVLVEAETAETSQYGRDFEVVDEQMRSSRFGRIELPARWRAPFERDNAATALETAALHLGGDFDRCRARRGLEATRWPGRLDTWALEPGALGLEAPVSVLFDAAHNPSAIEALLESLRERDLAIDAILVAGMQNKDLDAMFEPLATLAPLYGALLPRDRAAGREQLEATIPEHALAGIGPLDAMCPAAAEAAIDDRRPGRLLVVGSTFLIGACLEYVGCGAEVLATYHPSVSHP